MQINYRINKISQEQLIATYIKACDLELQAFKPGNVSVYADGHDMTVADFQVSARVSSEPITNPAYSLGQKIYYAVKETRKEVHCNTNLGILLLAGPLMQAIEKYQQNISLRDNLAIILQQTTVEDAAWVFKAITLAAPGGLGKSERQDANNIPNITLTETMKIASGKDRIALQYISNYQDIFEKMVLMYNLALEQWVDQKWAVAVIYADFLSQFFDSHIVRKYGNRFAGFVSAKMRAVTELMAVGNHANIMDMLFVVDADFKSRGINPGTTADLTVATLLTVELEQLLVTSIR